MKNKGSDKNQKTGAHILVDSLRAQEVKYIFGVPGASLMPILDILEYDRSADMPKFILCRHEQNAAFMAQAWGRLTGTPGVCLATAGPGATNLVTGVATATADRDPIIAITGENPQGGLFKKYHQNLATADLFRPITKMSHEVGDPETIPEAVATAFSTALQPRCGAVHLSFPIDILKAGVSSAVLPSKKNMPQSAALEASIAQAADILSHARYPVILVGVGVRNPGVADAVRQIVRTSGIPLVGTFESAGVLSRDLVPYFLGRVGLKALEPGDVALLAADVVLAVGYDTIEYNPAYWSTKKKRAIIHLDELPADPDRTYQPAVELLGSMAANLTRLSALLKRTSTEFHPDVAEAKKMLDGKRAHYRPSKTHIHPLQVMNELRALLGDEAVVCSDVGSHQVWLSQYFLTYRPNSLLFSMGFQTMGVALPWAMAATLARPKTPVVSVSGDGSFMMSATELETAVRLKMDFTHLVWRDGSYNLVKIQQQDVYKRSAGVEFGNPDIVKFAQSFGAAGYRVRSPQELKGVLHKALKTPGPVIVDIPIDYRDNLSLLQPGKLASLGL